MAVDVHWESIHEAWDANNVEFLVAFCPTGRPAARPEADLLEDFGDAADEVNVEAEERWLDHSPFIEDAADTTAGGAIALMNTAGDDGEVQACLRQLAERLTLQGWAGQVRGAPPVHPPGWATSVDAVGRALGLFLRFIPADTNDPEPRHETLSRHDLATLRDLADRWATRPATSTYLTRSMFTDIAPSHDLGAEFLQAVERHRRAGLQWIDDEHRSTTTIDLGYGTSAIFAIASRTETWHTRLDTLTRILQDLGPRLEVGLIDTANPMPISWTDLRTRPNPGSDQLNSIDDLDVAREHIPDAYGLQVLTSTHLAKAHDLSAWTITDLGNERHLVQHPDPAAWFAHQDPDPQVIAAARHDFGDIILTPERYTAILDAKRPPNPAAAAEA
ncbi:hypothetical protein ACQEVI_20755 [Promicromonospora sp. CA-289599]|uniref:hypothetical protein n=1 Tax=Promicromonospora sp. CA-289599 TaxID=3240014 RepID=UPI003D92D624